MSMKRVCAKSVPARTDYSGRTRGIRRISMSEINVKEKLEAIVARAMDSIDRAGDLNAL